MKHAHGNTVVDLQLCPTASNTLWQTCLFGMACHFAKAIDPMSRGRNVAIQMKVSPITENLGEGWRMAFSLDLELHINGVKKCTTTNTLFMNGTDQIHLKKLDKSATMFKIVSYLVYEIVP